MNESFERIEPHLYKRQYPVAGGEWRTLYYGIFKCWDGKRRRFPLGSELTVARDQLSALKGDNFRKVDFDKELKGNAKGITLSQWATIYFKEKVDPEKRSVEHERGLFKNLEPFFGGTPLSEISRAKIRQYRTMRLQQPIMRHGKPVKGSKVAFPSVNRELAFLRFLLNLAVDEDEELIESVPSFKKIIQSEKSRKRKRVVSTEEYGNLLKDMSRPNQRVIIGLYETAMRVNELVKLTWDKVDDKAGMIRLKAEDVKEKAPRTVPISPQLQAVLIELREEQKRVASISNRVFTRAGKPIVSVRTAFELAKERNSIVDLHIHDFRHTCITRWVMMGIPREVVMAASGHASIEMHNGYVNVQEHHLKEAFSVLPRCYQGDSLDSEKAASY